MTAHKCLNLKVIAITPKGNGKADMDGLCQICNRVWRFTSAYPINAFREGVKTTITIKE